MPVEVARAGGIQHSQREARKTMTKICIAAATGAAGPGLQRSGNLISVLLDHI